METIYEPNSSFEYSKLSLGQPQPSQGGSYFTKILFDNKPLYCQFPRCKTKQGIIQTDKKIYSDLLYDTNIHNELSNWLEHLESTFQQLIFEKITRFSSNMRCVQTIANFLKFFADIRQNPPDQIF